MDQAPAITSATSTTFTAGNAGSFTVTTTGYPTTALTESGKLARRGHIRGQRQRHGHLGGTPAAGTGGSTRFTINAANGVSPDATQTFTLTVDQAPAITSAASTTFTVGKAGSFTVTTSAWISGDHHPRRSGTLPSGVTFVDNHNGTATLHGTPAAGTGGAYSFTITASNGPSSQTHPDVHAHGGPGAGHHQRCQHHIHAGNAGSFTVTTTGYPTAALTESGKLPGGVTFVDNHNGTATLSGTPTASGIYTLIISAANGVLPAASQTFTLTVVAQPHRLPSPVLPAPPSP